MQENLCNSGGEVELGHEPQEGLDGEARLQENLCSSGVEAELGHELLAKSSTRPKPEPRREEEIEHDLPDPSGS